MSEFATNTPRWIYRFDNFKRAFVLLEDAVTLSKTRPLSELEKGGVIQRFEFTWELAWKLLKDYLEASGIVFETLTPAHVIRAAFSANLIPDGDPWMAALNARNIMSHTYSQQQHDVIIAQVLSHYYEILKALHVKFSAYEREYNASL